MGMAQSNGRHMLACVLLCALSCTFELCTASKCPGHSVHTSVFGDSLSDQGNLFKIINGVFPSPAAGYFNGRYTNARGVWVDYLKEWTEDKIAYENFAVAGATACPQFANVSAPTVIEQVSTYLAKLGNSSYAGRLHGKKRVSIIWIGHNDISNAAGLVVSGQLQPAALVADIVQCIAKVAQQLLAHGEHKVIIGNLAALERIPHVIALVPANALPAVQGMVNAVSLGLQQAISQLNAAQSTYPSKGKAYLWDIHTDLNNFINNFTCFGFKNATGQCVVYAPDAAFSGPNPSSVCTHPDDFVFWDGLHPVSKVHRRIIAHSIKRKLWSLGLA